MKNKLKVISTASALIVLLAACGSASSDAKKVAVQTAAAPAEKAVEAVSTAVEKLAKTKTETTAEKKIEQTPKAAASSKYVEGKHYVEIFPEMQTDAATGKVEVVELMWLGCPHCYTLEPRMLKYKKNHPSFVEFKQVPAMLNPSWAGDGNTFYLAEMLDPTGEKELITKVFQSIHEQKRRLRNPEAVVRFFKSEGFTEEQINNTRNSMAFKAKVRRAQDISAGSQAQSVPTIIINGKYRTSPYIAGSEDNLMEIIDMLTKRERK